MEDVVIYRFLCNNSSVIAGTVERGEDRVGCEPKKNNKIKFIYNSSNIFIKYIIPIESINLQLIFRNREFQKHQKIFIKKKMVREVSKEGTSNPHKPSPKLIRPTNLETRLNY